MFWLDEAGDVLLPVFFEAVNLHLEAREDCGAGRVGVGTVSDGEDLGGDGGTNHL